MRTRRKWDPYKLASLVWSACIITYLLIFHPERVALFLQVLKGL